MTPQLSTILQFHTGKLPGTDISSNGFEYPVLFSDVADDDQYHFGTLDISTVPADPIPYTWDVKFSIDNSGSMSDKCSDGRTKLHHIKHTLGNIIRLFSTYTEITFHVCIHTFNDTTRQIIDFTTVSKANVDEILAKISTIYDEGSTNLLQPITETTEQMTKRATTYPTNKQLHFLMTDGIDSCNNSSDTIIESVPSNYETVVFGFGIDHDSHTLMKIGDKPRCSYGFIAEIEKAGIIYGEYIHNILYRICTDVSIELQSAELYAWKTNTWENVLYLDGLASEMTKTFFVRTKNDPKTITGDIRGCICSLDGTQTVELFDTIELLPHLLDSSGELIGVDLLDHMFRYKTLELLYEANMIARTPEVGTTESVRDLSVDGLSSKDKDLQHNTSVFWRNRPPSVSNPYIIRIRKKLLNLYTNMQAYIKTRYPTGSPFMESLLDDIYVSRVSFEKANTRIFSLTRHRTQGNQNVYTPTGINDFIDSMSHTSKYDYLPDATDTIYPDDLEHQFASHTISQLSHEVYTSPTLKNVIRSTSDI